MATLLVLGSKPDPVLPSRKDYDDLACANASGWSAAQHGLPIPTYTVVSSILTSGKNASNTLALQALAGLGTETVYLYPRPPYRRDPLKRTLNVHESIRTSAFYFRHKLRKIGYKFERFVAKPLSYYTGMINTLCGYDEDVARLIQEKMPSTGVIAAIVGLGERRYKRVLISGFSFEIIHAHARNPDIEARGTSTSKHAETDALVLKCLSERHGCLCTTEPIVRERTGIPLLTVERRRANGAFQAS